MVWTLPASQVRGFTLWTTLVTFALVMPNVVQGGTKDINELPMCDTGVELTCNATSHPYGVRLEDDRTFIEQEKHAQGYVMDFWEPASTLCEHGILVPALNRQSPARAAAAYFFLMIYFFLAIAIISDVFMAAIEEITSKEKEVEVEVNGVKVKRMRPVWNNTVSNLTLMALGSSAPEILLSVVETITKLGSEPGSLGPGTIVGSAAFNLLLITSVCVASIPRHESKKLDDLAVFAVTAIFSLFAYGWLLFVLAVWTPDEVTVGEAVLTTIFFPLLVVVAWCQDQKWFGILSRTKKAQGEAPPLPSSPVSPTGNRLKGIIGRNMSAGNIPGGGEKGMQKFGIADIVGAVLEQAGRPRKTAYYRNAIRSISGAPRVLPERDPTKLAAEHKLLRQMSEQAMGKRRKSVINMKAVKSLQKQLERFHHVTGTWSEQFQAAMTLTGNMNEDGEMQSPSNFDYFMHFLTFFWKVLFACVPPPALLGGWLAFVVSLGFIALLVVVVGDLAELFGCYIGLSDYFTAITLVSLGTSLPDTFASRKAAMDEEFADNAIGNVTGSNSVNVFVGLGLPWLVATLWHQSQGTVYRYPAGHLTTSVLSFFLLAVLCIFILMVKRHVDGGELGGPSRFPAAMIIGSLWLLYLVTSLTSGSVQTGMQFCTLGLFGVVTVAGIFVWFLYKPKPVPPPEKPEAKRREEDEAKAKKESEQKMENSVAAIYKEDNLQLAGEVQALKVTLRNQNDLIRGLYEDNMSLSAKLTHISKDRKGIDVYPPDEPLESIYSEDKVPSFEAYRSKKMQFAKSPRPIDKESFHKVALDTKIYLQDRYNIRDVSLEELHKKAQEEQVAPEDWARFVKVHLMQ